MIRSRLENHPIFLRSTSKEIDPKKIGPGLKNHSLIVLLAFRRASKAIRLSRPHQTWRIARARRFGKCEQRFYIPVANTCQRNLGKKRAAQKVADYAGCFQEAGRPKFCFFRFVLSS
jgi:hypothetical protein